MRRLNRSLVTVRSTVALALTALLVAGGMGASATTIADEGLWYMDIPGVQEAHADGITGAGVTIAVIDSPVYLDLPTLRGANIEVQASTCWAASGDLLPSGTSDVAVGAHGTNVVSLIVGTGAGYPGQQGVQGVAPGARVLYYPFYSPDMATCHDANGKEVPNDLQMAHAITDAVAKGADIISISIGGIYHGDVREPLATALRHEVIVVTSLGNGSTPENPLGGGDGAPGIMNGVVSVLSAGPDGTLRKNGWGKPNTSVDVDVVGPGVNILATGHPDVGWEQQFLTDGNSLATPIVSANLALAINKYPNATPNQILQSMIHNTGTNGSHDAEWFSDYGYGIVVTATLLAADPTQYPDINPFIIENSDFGPHPLEIFGEDYLAPSPTPEPTDPITTPTPPGDNDQASLTPLIIVAVAVLLLIIGAIITIAVITSRKPKKETSYGPL